MSDWLAANLRQRAHYDAICRAERGKRVAIVGAVDTFTVRRLRDRIVIADEVDPYPAVDLSRDPGEV